MDLIQMRYELAIDRIREIKDENTVIEPYRDFFVKQAGFLLMLCDKREKNLKADTVYEFSLEELKADNRRMYEDILKENYHVSYGNPDVCEKVFGKEYGKLFCWLYAELRGIIPFAYENRLEDMTILLELFLLVYGSFADEEIVTDKQLLDMISSYNYDYCYDFTKRRISELVDPSLDFARKIIMESDLNDIRYLFKYGLYISESELRTASFLSSLSEEDIEAMANTYTEGYRKGFELAKKDLSKKKTVNIRYTVGFERMVKAAVIQFEKMGLKSVIYRVASRNMDSWSPRKSGYDSSAFNPQYDFDHSQDHGIYLNERIVSAKLSAMQSAFEEYKMEANTHAGPAVIETFGDEPFMPVSKESSIKLTKEQQDLMVMYSSKSGQITNRFIIGEERSFTIIAYPIPAIGENFEEIFKETVKINTLDYKTYQDIQTKLIDALDTGDGVHIKGKNGNKTDLYVKLMDIKDPEKETKFENCVADVNIPVGEVFTTPVLKGTNGTLHVKQVYLEGLNYIDLMIEIKDGMITDYSCGNFDTKEKGRAYIEENILFNHETLPIGEFAIGTNTTAYEVGRRFSIEDKLPILIAEKTGPHFAFGDTCYSWDEELHTFNPDGKEIIPKDNDFSILRKTDIQKAYFGCHTDITIPYDELGFIRVCKGENEEVSIIEDGVFSLAGCEELNIPLSK